MAEGKSLPNQVPKMGDEAESEDEDDVPLSWSGSVIPLNRDSNK